MRPLRRRRTMPVTIVTPDGVEVCTVRMVWDREQHAWTNAEQILIRPSSWSGAVHFQEDGDGLVITLA